MSIVSVLCFVEFMNQYSFERFNCLFDCMFYFSGLASICENRESAMTAKSFIVIINYICAIISSCFVMGGMHNKLLINLSDAVVSSFVSAIVIYSCP